MVETFIIFVIFSFAVYYIGKTMLLPFFTKSKAGCAKGCGSCGTVDFDKIVADQIAKDSANL